MNKRGGFADLFVFMIIAFIIILIAGVWIYVGSTIETNLQDTLGQMDLKSAQGDNASEVISQTIGVTNTTFKALHWISVLLIVGMILSIFIGSYLVTTKPIFFIPYLFIVIIAIVVSVPMSNAYETLLDDESLGDTISDFKGSTFIMLNLPIWITIVGFGGAIIMFTRMGRREEIEYYER
jgi:hypothetical protein